MKTAISIPDDVFAAAEAAARRTGVSRSQFYVEAVKLFLTTHGERGVTERLDAVYGELDSKLDPVLSDLQAATTRSRSTW